MEELLVSYLYHIENELDTWKILIIIIFIVIIIYIRMPNCEDWLTAGMSYIMLLAILSVRKCVAYI